MSDARASGTQACLGVRTRHCGRRAHRALRRNGAQVNTLTQLAAMRGRELDHKLATWEREIQATLARTAL